MKRPFRIPAWRFLKWPWCIGRPPANDNRWAWGDGMDSLRKRVR